MSSVIDITHALTRVMFDYAKYREGKNDWGRMTWEKYVHGSIVSCDWGKNGRHSHLAAVETESNLVCDRCLA